MFWHVVRDASRALRSAPAVTAGIIFILTLGIAAATITFSVVDTVVLRPLPFEDDHELAVVEMRSSDSPFPTRTLGAYQYFALRARVTTFESIAATTQTGRLALNANGETEPLANVQVTATLFDVLGVRPIIGQTFTADHEIDGNQRVALLGYDLWQRRFGGNPAVVGQAIPVVRTMDLGGATREEMLTIVGVMPRGFSYPMTQPAPEIWTPYVMTAEERANPRRGQYLHVIGRLRSDSSLEPARAEARAVGASLVEADAEFHRNRQLHVVPLKDTLVENVRGWMLLVLGAVTVVMLIACVNVANLQLVRATRRTRELSIRASLGATRRQLVASLLVESLLLSLMAATLAIAAATWGIELAKAELPANLARVTEIGLDLRVLAATISAAVVTGLLFGVVPAWQASREDLVSLLKQGTMTPGVARRRWRAAFVIAEVAFVSVLLVGATLIISSFVRVTTADLGFDRSNLLFINGDLGADTAGAAARRLESLPGVVNVGAVAMGSPPLAGAGFRGGGATAFALTTADALPGTEPLIVEWRGVSSNYFATAGIPIVRGDRFDDSAAPEAGIIIDERVASALFGQRDAVGAEVVMMGTNARRAVVGVVRHVRLSGPEQTSAPQAYGPLPLSWRGATPGFMARPNFLVRTSAPPATVIPAIRAAFPDAVTSGNAALQIRPLEDAFRNITADRRFNAGLMSIFSVLAVVIGAAGVYGVLASIVAQQTREMAVRVALGATTGRMVSSVIAQAGRYLAAGLLVGLIAAWWASQGLASILYDVRPTDVSVYATVAGVMIAVGALAACIPAWRAARVDPVVALRSE